MHNFHSCHCAYDKLIFEKFQFVRKKHCEFLKQRKTGIPLFFLLKQSFEGYNCESGVIGRVT